MLWDLGRDIPVPTMGPWAMHRLALSPLEYPKGLDFHHLAFDKAIEFVKSHVGQVARWWDIQPRRDKGARVMAATATNHRHVRSAPL